MPVLITGMHRSGTSMIARLLNLCGLYLGEPDEMIDPRPDNPRGFWEHYCFLMIDMYILMKFGYHELLDGEMPILLQEHWHEDPGLKTCYLWGQRMAHSMTHSTDGEWGFKDCRASVLLPFWYNLVPDLKVVVCLRHPLDVAASVVARRSESADEEQAIWVWYTYNRMLMDTVKEHHIVRYDDFFVQPMDWCALQALCDFCGLEPDIAALREVVPELRHHRTRSGRDLPEKIANLYREMGG